VNAAELRVSLKCEPALAEQTLKDMIEDSYDLVVSKLPRSRRPPGWQTR
jgi:predicted DNA-binding protein (MmcQ/YjbR family)